MVVSSDEAGAYRKTDLRRRAQLRRANVGRRTSISRRLYSGEAAVVGGDDLFGSCPPAEGMAARRWASAPMSGVLIGRQTCAGELSSGERMLAGGGCMAGG